MYLLIECSEGSDHTIHVAKNYVALGLGLNEPRFLL